MSPAPLPLTTDRLTLRPHTEADQAGLLGIYSREDVARFLLEDPWTPQSAAGKITERIAKSDLDGESGALALVIDLDGTPIGDVQLWFTDRELRICEIGWVLNPDRGGHGYAAEAVAAVLELAFVHLRVHRVAAQMDARNTASARLADRVGMTREAHLRQDWWNKGEFTDTVVYGMLADDR